MQGLSDLPYPSDRLLSVLKGLGVAYTLYRHDPIFTVEQGVPLKAQIPGLHCRNLFLRDQKEAMFLVVVGNDTRLDLKKLSGVLGAGRLSFGSAERLWRYLGIRQGSVNPFCILNDAAHKVRLILDAAMMQADLVNYHPMDNAMTIGLAPSALLRVMDLNGRRAEIVDLSMAAPD